MMKPGCKRPRIFFLAAVLALFATLPLQAEVREMSKKVGGTTVHYKMVLPNGYDAAKAYPGILALGGGSLRTRRLPLYLVPSALRGSPPRYARPETCLAHWAGRRPTLAGWRRPGSSARAERCRGNQRAIRRLGRLTDRNF